MTDTTIVSEKFTVTYKFKVIGRGNASHNGFLDYSQDHPSFADEPADHYLRDSLAQAIKDALMVETNMRTYHGHEKVDFDSIRVVRYRTVIETIDDINMAVIDELVISARNKLTDDELGALAAELRKDFD